MKFSYKLRIDISINLIGSIPTSIYNLQLLTCLQLSNNGFNGWINSSESIIDLVTCLFIGTISSSINKMTSMTQLLVQNNKFTGKHWIDLRRFSLL